MSDPVPPTLGLVLAGGLARRMGGGDKARIEIGGVTILDRVLATLSAQCTGIVINANGDPKRFADTGLPVIPDNVAGHPGPLAGILAGLDWLAAQDNGVEWIVSVPGDCPFLPDDLVERLHRGAPQNGRRRAARLRALGRMAPSGGRPMAAGAARRPAPGAGRRGPAQDRGVDGAAWRRHRRLAGRADRSVLQRQYARGCRNAPRALRCSKPADARACLLDRARRFGCYRLEFGLGRGTKIMKRFIIACAAAIVIAVIGGVVLNSVQEPADQAFTSPDARLGA